jgi:putative PEP-CTERM system histidine kinase
LSANASVFLYTAAAVFCLAWSLLVLAIGRSASAPLLAAACAISGLWAGAVALTPSRPLEGLAGVLEVFRLAVWFVVLLAFYRRVIGPAAGTTARRFAWLGGIAVLLALLSLLPQTLNAIALPSLGSPVLLARLGVALLVVLLAENLYRSADEEARWYVNLPCIALGGLAVFDLLLYADAALSRSFSMPLLNARAALTALAVSLLAIAAVRDGRWRQTPRFSRQAVFHGATLIVAGAFLLGVGALGEVLRLLQADWGATVQASLLAGASLMLAVALTSASIRSRVRNLVVDHFFSARYDYRREWLRCVALLSAPDDDAPPERRAIRAMADPVDSPAGLLLIRDPAAPTLRWAGSWNLASAPLSLPAHHPLAAALGTGERVLEFDTAQPAPADLVELYGPCWLAVPLAHPREGLVGAILLAPPRAPFVLDREVFDLLRTIGREVAMFLAERRAAERLAEQRPIEDYARRFAFVAHDVKTVASQLTMLLANAEDNIQDPEFQADMLLTVRASADRINTLISRLGQPGEVMAEPGPQPTAALDPLALLQAMAETQPHPVQVTAESPAIGRLAMPADSFQTACGHLLNNAIEASPPAAPVEIRLRRAGSRIEIDIADRGAGMVPEFVRDELFRPLSTSKAGGSGIGAWQARELLASAGGELTVLSQPGMGTTMRLVLPAADAGTRSATAQEGSRA